MPGRWLVELLSGGFSGAVAFRSFCYKVRMGIARLLEWVVYVGVWIAHLPELPKAYWRK